MAKSKTPPPGMKVCDRCQDGWVEYDEDGRMVRDACYHCGNTGFISDEQVYLDRINHVAESLAADAVEEMRRDRNNNADAFGGEGWDFLAAEHGVSEREYTEGQYYAYSARMMGVFEQMLDKEPALLRALINRLAPLPKEEEQPPPTEEEYFNDPDRSPPKGPPLVFGTPTPDPENGKSEWDGNDIPF